MDKTADAYRTISEAAEDLGLQQHVLRFWETRFPQIKPLKRSGGRRYYRPEDVDFIAGIKLLLHGERYTIKGAQKIIKEKGAKFVAAVGRDPALMDGLAPETGDDRPVAAAPPPAQTEAPILPVKGRDHLQSVLFELSECRRVLAAARA
jgi:DNA-binding transcriptional MerR regulator